MRSYDPGPDLGSGYGIMRLLPPALAARQVLDAPTSYQTVLRPA